MYLHMNLYTYIYIYIYIYIYKYIYIYSLPNGGLLTSFEHNFIAPKGKISALDTQIKYSSN